MPIESGPNAERKVRSFLLFLLVAIFAILFGYDGWFGYARNNVKDFLMTLPADQRPPAGSLPVYEAVNDENISRLKELKIQSTESPEAAIGAILGGPPSLRTADAMYWIGPAHKVRFVLRDGRLTGEINADKLKHTDTDIRWQKYYGYGLTVLAAMALIYVIRVRTARARLDESGLTLRSGPTISWESMKSLDSSSFRKKGWVDLHHGDPEECTRIDEYHFARFDEIIDALCARKGFDNPLIKASTESSDTPADQPEV